jgi:hypothetical protein
VSTLVDADPLRGPAAGDEVPFFRLPQEPIRHKLLQDVVASDSVERPESASLLCRETESGHLAVLASDARE